MTDTINSLVDFLEFLNKFQNIKRTIYVANSSPRVFENDAEHSYQLAMAGWYLATTQNLDLDTNLIIQCALVHDLVEAYSGDLDPFMYGDTAEFQALKQKNEEEAFNQIKNEFEHFSQMVELIEEYEKKDSQEAMFIYSLDKVLAHINVTKLDKRSFKDCGISRDSIIQMFHKKVSQSPPMEKIYQHMIEEFNQIPDFYAEKDFIPEYKKEFLKKNN